MTEAGRMAESPRRRQALALVRPAGLCLALTMLEHFENETIVALATPPGKGGIGVIRISGARGPEVLANLFRGRHAPKDFQSHKLYLGRLLHPETEECLDEGMAVWMRAPHSYTGEDVVELQLHGGPLLLNRVLETLVAQGLKLAAAGEFTRRAFLNGKMDLLQAEAVAELIHAQSEAALQNARAQLQGRLSGKIQAMREQLLHLQSRVEAAIDFPEEDIELISRKQSLTELQASLAELQQWREQFALGRLLKEGVRVVLVGRPNVGKSSLLNRLLGEERAIVHHRPGTTRDVVEGGLHVGGVFLQVFDTAGIREGEGEVEQEGIRRSRRAAEQADLTLWVVDGSEPPGEADRAIGTSLGARSLVIANKQDLGQRATGLPKTWQINPVLLEKDWVWVSAATGKGIPEMKTAILREVGLEHSGNHAYLNNARHRQALELGLEALRRAELGLSEALPAECIAADLRQGSEYLGALVGAISSEDILDKIFSDFCIGK